MPGPVSNDQFFARVGELLEENKKAGHGSVFFTQKRLTPSNVQNAEDKDPLWDVNLPGPFAVLIRATNGKSKENRDDKIKVSTVVQPESSEEFFKQYADVCKAGMQALKPKDRSKRKKKKAKKRKGPVDGEKKP
ncbi:signal recognition particle, SRP9/SRP14 subunit [Eremomyces bilateralis CBS 781.70]|uniref:Signal recognition particle subunit SRP14 n=1 Tax=Eremomyces bilateralis CBS 781.70 TaxID=1392243 RepID=A0A6G1FTJ0_9PEZI|nr:signal recognition particle, SRP9/SRP14 subunit [Eremomyces bilateralis CBS 781.70]KAF1809046.1 signal recognition particle, SRP9/SRP14 subunit [Eremomyces bilateralis CBS 781.70]